MSAGADPNSTQDKNNSAVYQDGFRDYTVVMSCNITRGHTVLSESPVLVLNEYLHPVGGRGTHECVDCGALGCLWLFWS